VSWVHFQDGLAAGTETTTLTSEWAMAQILQNPNVGKKARLELDQVVGLKRAVDESDIPQLKYIQAILKETLRLHAAAPLLIPHQSMSATKAFGYDIPAKTRLFVNVWAIGQDPSIWEKPLDFIPERFLEGGPHEMVEVQGQHFELLPFGAGRRQCPGMVFGLTVVQLQMASLLHAFDWSLPNGMTPDMLDMTNGLGLSPPMRIPLVAVAKPRLPSHLYQQ
jgi:cytochrome P450